MKITREQLKNLIIEEVKTKQSMLLEMPGDDGLGLYTYSEEDKETSEERMEEHNDVRNLYLMARKLDQLHDILKSKEDLNDEVRLEIRKINKNVTELLDAAVYDKDNPEVP